MAKRGTGTITVDDVTTRFRAPTQPQQAVMPQVSPEETRLKKFYTEQYNIEANTFIRNKMSRDQFDRGIGQLQTKYKLAFNQAKTKLDQPDPVFKQYSELDVYRGRLEGNIKNFRIMPSGKIPSFWRPRRWEKTAPTELQIFDPSKLKYTAKGEVSEGSVQGAWRKARLEEIEQYGTLTNELRRITAAQDVLLQRPTSDLMKTAAISPRIGGSIKDQVRDYIEAKEQRPVEREPEDLSQLSDEELRRIVGDR